MEGVVSIQCLHANEMGEGSISQLIPPPHFPAAWVLNFLACSPSTSAVLKDAQPALSFLLCRSPSWCSAAATPSLVFSVINVKTNQNKNSKHLLKFFFNGTMKYYHPESRWYDAHERKNGRSLGPRHFILKQKKIDLWKGGSINEREFEKQSSIYLTRLNMLFSICSYQPWQFSQNRRSCTLISKTQSHVHCSHQLLLGRPWEILLGLEGDSSWEGDYHTCQSSLLRLPTALRWVTLAWGGHRGASVDPLLPQPYPIQTTPVEHSEVL